MRGLAVGVMISALIGITPLAVAQPKTRGSVNVRKNFELTALMTQFSGVVEEIDEQGLTLLTRDTWRKEKWNEELKLTFRPVDLLAEGKLLQGANAGFAYRWKDVKKGDSVQLDGKYDRDEERWYCLALSVWRRPGAKLPESQDAKNDTNRYRRFSLLNDIDNGEDVPEKEITELFPGEQDRRTGGLITPTTFPAEYRGKLNAIRDKLDAEKTKKEKDLKATPPDKK